MSAWRKPREPEQEEIVEGFLSYADGRVAVEGSKSIGDSAGVVMHNEVSQFEPGSVVTCEFPSPRIDVHSMDSARGGTESARDSNRSIAAAKIENVSMLWHWCSLEEEPRARINSCV